MAKKVAKITCARCRREYSGVQIRLCRANEKYICYYCCKKCRFREKTPHSSILGCNLGCTGKE